MSFGSGAGTRVAYVAQAAFDALPATPVFKVARLTRADMRTNKSTGINDELRPDRDVLDEYLLGLDPAGSYDFKLSYASFDDFMAGALESDWATNVLKNGIVPKWFGLEETVELGATDAFNRFIGSQVNTLSLDITARQEVRGVVNFMAREEVTDTAIITGATYTPANSNKILTASADVGVLQVGALDPAPKIRSINFQFNNNLRTRPVVGGLLTEEFGHGRFDCTGRFTAYFETNDLYAAALAHETAAISVTIGSVTGEKYTFLFPRAQLLNGARQVGGNDTDIMVEVPFRATRDATEGCSVKITRAVA